MKKLLLAFLTLVVLVSCEQLDPRPIQDLTTEDLWSHATYGEGILTTAYINLETNYNIGLEYYTDNAVPSQPGANRLALGNWTVENNTISGWDGFYENIKYLNLFLENAKDLSYFVSDTEKDSLFNHYRYGEAYYLRAWYQWRLLQNYGGFPKDGNMALGYPIVTKALNVDDNLDLPRNTYEECVQQIIADCDTAFNTIPLDYTDRRDPYIGRANRGRGSGLAAKTLKARVYLYAASPAFGNSNPETWSRAAEAAAEAIDAAGGLADLSSYGNFNTGTNYDYIWSSSTASRNDWEYMYYPPSLYGQGACNPSQNLVDAFPASDGYPISESAVYDPNDPYNNRDSRLDKFIFYNGDEYKAGANTYVIDTYVGGDDAPGGISFLGTRTGYYLKKFLSEKVSLNVGSVTSDYKFKVLLGKTELYLNFAEAANEAFGPYDDRYGFSAFEVMEKIRSRALGSIDDTYMKSQADAGKDAFRAFIHNERRVELCFEEQRFWDLRRWNEDLNHSVKGVSITQEGSGFTYEYTTVENHEYKDYMRFVPLPYDQTLIMTNLKQNQGW
ncbi:RagB/SusD family nutrient uptake outer membrane protein [Saccharicrinis sp. FJH54]|uniref:RagB/SusD family nutrient uptake outer membrane protein n=1 Tax=Saccharicrinis sp. FJH54 TaxID=3344665 RepID=UPI0035D4073D